MWDDKLCRNVMARSDFFFGEYSVISEIWPSLQISKLIRSQISYAIHDFVTVDEEIIASDTTLKLSADLLFLVITCTYNSLFLRKMFVADIHEFTFSLMRFWSYPCTIPKRLPYKVTFFGMVYGPFHIKLISRKTNRLN